MTSAAWGANGNANDVRSGQLRARMPRGEAGPAGRTGKWNPGVGEETESDVDEKTQSEMRESGEGGS